MEQVPFFAFIPAQVMHQVRITGSSSNITKLKLIVLKINIKS